MAEVVEKTGVTKEKGYLYYLDKQGDVSRSKMARAGKGGGNAEKVATAGVTRESGYLYFIDKNGHLVDFFYSTTDPLSPKITNLIN